MELFFLILLVVLLVIFAYAQWQKDVVKTPGRMMTNYEEEENKL